MKTVPKTDGKFDKLQKGNEVITIGGLYRTIDEVDTDRKDRCLDVDGVYLTFELGAIKTVLLYQKESATTGVAQMPIQPSKNNHQRRGKGLFLVGK